MLIRDVSYGQIPRADRSAKHRRAAEWIGLQGRPEDHADLLAHHWGSALRLAEAAGLDTTVLIEPARLALRAAGDRSNALSAFQSAATFYAEALDLWPENDADRPELLFRYARAAVVVGISGAVEAIEWARDALLSVGALERAAEAETLLADAAWLHGQRDVGVCAPRTSTGADRRRRRARRHAPACSVRYRATLPWRDAADEARQAKDPQTVVPALVSRVVIETMLGHPDTASDLRSEVIGLTATSREARRPTSCHGGSPTWQVCRARSSISEEL